MYSLKIGGFKCKRNLKKTLISFDIIALINLLYLNVLVPITVSFQQVFLVALEIVKISNDKGIDLATIPLIN